MHVLRICVEYGLALDSTALDTPRAAFKLALKLYTCMITPHSR